MLKKTFFFCAENQISAKKNCLFHNSHVLVDGCWISDFYITSTTNLQNLHSKLSSKDPSHTHTQNAAKNATKNANEPTTGKKVWSTWDQVEKVASIKSNEKCKKKIVPKKKNVEIVT